MDLLTFTGNAVDFIQVCRLEARCGAPLPRNTGHLIFNFTEKTYGLDQPFPIYRYTSYQLVRQLCSAYQIHTEY